tara:strand:+ start:2962 stop:3744 length:783 start_codon:yes stop_codon:yes gene_type:complete
MNQENNKNIIYEHPMNERVRSLLRIEHLYKIIEYNLKSDTEYNCRAVIEALLNISDLLIRSDIKNEIIKELKRQLDILEILKNNNEVDIDRLVVVCDEIDRQLKTLQNQSFHPGENIRNNELIRIFSQRINIPGGSCNFDLPRLNYWFKKSESKRKQDLSDWSSDLIPIKETSHVLLENIRKSRNPTYENAEAGFYHKQVGANIQCQLIRVIMSSMSPYYPDISGVKHRFSIRFMEEIDSNMKSMQTNNNVYFELHCCIL